MILLEDLMAIVVDKMRTVDPLLPTVDDEGEQPPHYLYGHPHEVNQSLIERTNAALEKYPLVYLMLDYDWDVFKGMIHFNANVILLEYTDLNYNSVQRTENVFRPKLLPLYERFLIALRKVGFSWEGAQDQPPHKGVVMPFYGTKIAGQTSSNKESIFTDPLDAVGLFGIKINYRNNKC
jgi:hypothetical protein